MSVLAILLHFSRTVIQAHNNAKVRNLMDTRARIEAGEETAATDGDGRSAQRRETRSK